MKKHPHSLQGKLILDTGKLSGSFFEKTVILICRHNEAGAFGLVLNRPAKKTLSSVVDEPLSDSLANLPLHHGGPVQPDFLSFLHQTSEQPDYEILPCLTLGHSLKELQHHTELHPSSTTHAFIGYAGWTEGQLENELKHGAWFTHPSSIKLIFQTHPNKLWHFILSSMGGIYRLASESPDDPSLN